MRQGLGLPLGAGNQRHEASRFAGKHHELRPTPVRHERNSDANGRQQQRNSASRLLSLLGCWWWWCAHPRSKPRSNPSAGRAQRSPVGEERGKILVKRKGRGKEAFQGECEWCGTWGHTTSRCHQTDERMDNLRQTGGQKDQQGAYNLDEESEVEGCDVSLGNLGRKTGGLWKAQDALEAQAVRPSSRFERQSEAEGFDTDLDSVSNPTLTTTSPSGHRGAHLASW